MEHIPENPASYPGAAWECCEQREEAKWECFIHVLSRIKAPAACPDFRERRDLTKDGEFLGRSSHAPSPSAFPRQEKLDQAPRFVFPIPLQLPRRKKFPGKVLENSQLQAGHRWIRVIPRFSLFLQLPKSLAVTVFPMGTCFFPNSSLIYGTGIIIGFPSPSWRYFLPTLVDSPL